MECHSSGHTMLRRRLTGVMLVGLVLLDTLMVAQTASISQKLNEYSDNEIDNNINTAVDVVGFDLGLRKLILHERSGGIDVDKTLSKVPSSSHSQTPGGSSGSVQVGLGSSVRQKRWDFRMDGCHCDGYNIECIHDSTCQRRRRSRYWKCSHTCCGFQCVSYHRQQQQQQEQQRQRQNVTQRPSRNSTTHTALNETRTAVQNATSAVHKPNGAITVHKLNSTITVYKLPTDRGTKAPASDD